VKAARERRWAPPSLRWPPKKVRCYISHSLTTINLVIVIHLPLPFYNIPYFNHLQKNTYTVTHTHSPFLYLFENVTCHKLNELSKILKFMQQKELIGHFSHIYTHSPHHNNTSHNIFYSLQLALWFLSIKFSNEETLKRDKISIHHRDITQFFTP